MREDKEWETVMLAVGGKRVAICRQGGGRDAALRKAGLLLQMTLRTLEITSLWEEEWHYSVWRNSCVIENNLILDGNNWYKTEKL